MIEYFDSKFSKNISFHNKYSKKISFIFFFRGLDSSSCTQCISLLRSLARQGRTVVCTVHQPSALLFERFDQIYVLVEGHAFYRGSPLAVQPFLTATTGLRCPQYHNPADFSKYFLFVTLSLTFHEIILLIFIFYTSWCSNKLTAEFQYLSALRNSSQCKWFINIYLQ